MYFVATDQFIFDHKMCDGWFLNAFIGHLYCHYTILIWNLNILLYHKKYEDWLFNTLATRWNNIYFRHISDFSIACTSQLRYISAFYPSLLGIKQEDHDDESITEKDKDKEQREEDAVDGWLDDKSITEKDKDKEQREEGAVEGWLDDDQREG